MLIFVLLRCDMGTHGACWLGDYCMPEGSTCPVACNTPEPTQCGDTDMMCDNGMDINGCWLGNSCMPEGSECPHICYPMMTMECGATDIRC